MFKQNMILQQDEEINVSGKYSYLQIIIEGKLTETSVWHIVWYQSKQYNL